MGDDTIQKQLVDIVCNSLGQVALVANTTKDTVARNEQSLKQLHEDFQQVKLNLRDSAPVITAIPTVLKDLENAVGNLPDTCPHPSITRDEVLKVITFVDFATPAIETLRSPWTKVILVLTVLITIWGAVDLATKINTALTFRPAVRAGGSP